MAKTQQWLQAGCRMVWVIDPQTKTVTVYSSPREATILTTADVLDGGDLLAGLRLPVAEIFPR